MIAFFAVLAGAASLALATTDPWLGLSCLGATIVLADWLSHATRRQSPNSGE